MSIGCVLLPVCGRTPDADSHPAYLSAPLRSGRRPRSGTADRLSFRGCPVLVGERGVVGQHTPEPEQRVVEVGVEDFGVYNCQRGTDRIRIVVVAELPQQEHNAPLHLFSASGQKVEFGARSYRPRSEETSGLLLQLLAGYFHEGEVTMSYTLEDFQRDFLARHGRELIKKLPPEQRVEGLTPEQRVEGLSVEELERLLEKRRQEEAPQKAKKPARKKPKR
jgi:hypothetical protein